MSLDFIIEFDEECARISRMLVDESADEKKLVRRPMKGKSLLSIMKDFTVIDIETTGLDPRFDSIIELSAIRYRNAERQETFTTLVNPECEIDEYITELTGITNDDLADAPVLDTVLLDYLAFLSDDVLLGHNVNFDINFIYDNAEFFHYGSLTNDFIDTMRLSRRLFPEYKHHRLADLVDRFHVTQTPAHRAEKDCLATVACYFYMSDYIDQNGIDIDSIVNRRHRCVSASEITPSNIEFDENHPLYNKCCVFTGELQKMSRREAMQAVADVGGICGDSVTKATNYLILGSLDYCKSIKEGKSNKQKRAEKYKLAGIDIEIISENVFYEMLQEE